MMRFTIILCWLETKNKGIVSNMTKYAILDQVDDSYLLQKAVTAYKSCLVETRNDKERVKR